MKDRNIKGQFMKGHKIGMKNKYHTELTKRKIAKKNSQHQLKRAKLGIHTGFQKGHLQYSSYRFPKGHIPWSRGKTKENSEYGRLISERMKINNPSYNPEIRAKMSKSLKENYASGKIKPWNNEKKMLEISGKNNPNWNGGTSFLPYGKEFNKELKEAVRKRDNYRCQECFRHQSELRTKNNKSYKLNIHHIDFNKNNNSIQNLISLCQGCHAQTNYNRQEWINYFQNKLK